MSLTTTRAGAVLEAVTSLPVDGLTSSDGSLNLTGRTATDAVGTGGTAPLTGGAGAAGTGTTAGGVGGAASVTGGAGGAKATTGAAAGGAGGAASCIGGVGGATASSGTDAGGAGGAATVKGGAGGAASAGTGNGGLGGAVVISTSAGGASAGGSAGVDGMVALRAVGNILHTFQRAASVAKSDADGSLTVAQFINGHCTHTVTTGRTMTTPTGAQLSAAFGANLAVGDCFLFTLATVGSGADDISTLTAGDGNVTFVSSTDQTVGPSGSTFNAFGTWYFRNSGTNTWVGHRIG